MGVWVKSRGRNIVTRDGPGGEVFPLYPHKPTYLETFDRAFFEGDREIYAVDEPPNAAKLKAEQKSLRELREEKAAAEAKAKAERKARRAKPPEKAHAPAATPGSSARGGKAE